MRAAVQLIPGVGGALDTLFSGLGAKYQQQRLMHFLEELSQRLSKVEDLADIQPSEALYDFIVNAMIQASTTRSEEKRKRFASIVTKQISQKRQWDEAEDALRILGEMSDSHMEVLSVATSVPPCDGPFDGLRVVTLVKQPLGKGIRPTELQQALPESPYLTLRRICAELLSRGLLDDDGVGRVDTKAMQYFVASEIATWFIGWVADE